MNKTAAVKKLEAARDQTNSKFGAQSAAIGNEHYAFNVVSWPAEMMNYKSGIGGAPYGHMVEVYGSNGLGKTSALGYGVLANVQREGKLPAIIAMEPTFDAEWAFKLHGLDKDLLLLNRPDNAEEAFAMLHDLVYGGLVDYILIDSIGAMASKSETEEDAKKKAYGVSGIVTTGLAAVMPRLYKNNQGLMIINQQRQAGSFQGNIVYESPGGEALKHHAMVRIHVKPGKRYKTKIDGEDVTVGRELICVFKKNKLAQGADKKARFDFFNIDTDEYGLGVDQAADIINTGRLSGVIKSAGAWLHHDSFPDGKLNGKKAVDKFLKEHPEVRETLNKELLARMVENEIKAAEQNAKATASAEVEIEETDNE